MRVPSRSFGAAESCLEVLVVVGTRPEAIKMVPVILRLREAGALRPVVVSTGQHNLMVEDVMTSAGIEIAAVIAEDGGRGGLNNLMQSVVLGIERFCVARWGDGGSPGRPGGALDDGGSPCAVLVHGDTTSALAAALAAFHLRIPVAHVEAGLRTGGSIAEPFPEELNRQAIGRIACLHFAPTGRSAENLVREGVPLGQVLITGNTAIDSFAWALGLEAPYGDARLERIDSGDRHVVLVTAHRRESWGGGLSRVAEAVVRLAARFGDCEFVVCVHPNPLVQRELGQPLQGVGNICATGPLPYAQFARLIARSRLIVTDSGGIQEEAPSIGKPVLVTRDRTERLEALEAGTVELVGMDPERIVESASRALEDRTHATPPENPYGDGRAAERIAAALAHLVGVGDAPEPFGPAYERCRALEVAGRKARPAPGGGLRVNPGVVPAANAAPATA